MIIIGIHNTGMLSSAALFVDGSLVYGCAEERLNRQKYCKYFPQKAVEACLRFAKKSLADVDYLALAWNPAIPLAGRRRAGFSEWPGYLGARLYSNPNHLLPQLDLADLNETEQIFSTSNGTKVRFSYVTHHLAHMMGRITCQDLIKQLFSPVTVMVRRQQLSGALPNRVKSKLSKK